MSWYYEPACLVVTQSRLCRRSGLMQTNKQIATALRPRKDNIARAALSISEAAIRRRAGVSARFSKKIEATKAQIVPLKRGMRGLNSKSSLLLMSLRSRRNNLR